ncbi:MAG: hypothetical protein WB773_28955, partial [Isosphaeraceae bacterium]
VSQAEPVDAQSRPFRSLTVILTLGVMVRFPPWLSGSFENSDRKRTGSRAESFWFARPESG